MMPVELYHFKRKGFKVADLFPTRFRKQSATDGTKLDLNIGDSGPNLQPWD